MSTHTQKTSEPIRLKLSDFGDDDLIEQADIQRIFGVCRTTVWRWQSSGLLEPLELTARFVRYRVGDVKKAIREAPKRAKGRKRRLRETA